MGYLGEPSVITGPLKSGRRGVEESQRCEGSRGKEVWNMSRTQALSLALKVDAGDNGSGHPAPSNRGVRPVTRGLHAAWDGYECGPT